jgi:hypothetical protein
MGRHGAPMIVAGAIVVTPAEFDLADRVMVVNPGGQVGEEHDFEVMWRRP